MKVLLTTPIAMNDTTKEDAAFSMKKPKLEAPDPSDARAAAPAPVPRKMAPAKYKKAPDAPKRFKSAFIIFSAEKHKEIKEDLTKQGRAEKTTDIAKLVSEAWRELNAEDKEVWEKKARKDKARYEVEKAMYKGPWKIPANKRTPKDPTAPKRPMSAFLAFSNKRRAALKRQTPDATNADLSKMLSVTWKKAPDELRKKYMEEEAELRQKYKIAMAAWRRKVADEKKEERKEREAMAMQAAEARQNQPAAAISQGFYGQLGGDQLGGVANGGGAPSQDASQGGLAGAGGGMFNPYLGAMGGGGGMDMSALQNFQGGYPGLLGNPFAAQSLMQGMSGGGGGGQGGGQSQQQLLQQLLASQQLMQQQQRGGLGMYGGMQGMQGMQGMSGQGSGMGGFGMGGSGDMQAAQRAMLEAAQAGQQGQGMGGQGMGGFGQMGQMGAFGLSGQGQGRGQQGQSQEEKNEEAFMQQQQGFGRRSL